MVTARRNQVVFVDRMAQEVHWKAHEDVQYNMEQNN